MDDVMAWVNKSRQGEAQRKAEAAERQRRAAEAQRRRQEEEDEEDEVGADVCSVHCCAAAGLLCMLSRAALHAAAGLRCP